MQSTKEKITLSIIALVYVLFHIPLPGTGVAVKDIVAQLISMVCIEAGLTYLLVMFIRSSMDGIWPPWDRIARIFFTIGIMVGFLYALFGMAYLG